MATKFTIRCLLPLPIWWHGFLPDNQDDWLKFSTKQENKEVIVTIGITDRSSQMEVIGDLDISKELYFPGNSLVITFQSEWSQDLVGLMRGDSKNEEVTKFFKDVESIIDNVYTRVIDLLRNQFGQYWLSPTLPRDNKAWNDAEWLDSDGEWKPVFPPTIYLVSRIRKQGMSKGEWEEFGNLLKHNSRSDMMWTMIANARVYLEIDNGRMAVVEAVAALEAALKQLLPKLLSRLVSPHLPEKSIDKAIEKMGLRLTTEILFEYMEEKHQLGPENCKQCLSAIEIRNTIIHQKQRHVDVSKAGTMVEAIAEIVVSLARS